jgi:hypothetical protein
MQLENSRGIPMNNIFHRLFAVGIAFIAFTQLDHNVKSVQVISGVAHTYVLDDSMITLRVASNFARGGGPYFNVGEHTAANTSLFWPLFLSLRFHHGIGLPDAVLSLSHFSSLLCLVIFGVVALSAESNIAAYMVLFLLVISPCFLEYGPSIWEHIPQSLFVTLAICIYLRKISFIKVWREESALLLLSLAFLVRPDTLPLLAIFFALALFKLYRQRSWISVVSICSCLSLIGLYFALHHHFYGTFAPNTYYLKVAFGLASIKTGVHYLKQSAFQCIVPLLIAYLALFSFGRKRTTLASDKLVIACFILQVCYIVVVGGDVFLFGRFFVLLAPITCLLFCERLTHLTSRDYGKISAAFVIIIYGIIAFSHFRESIADIQVSTGREILLKEDAQAAQASMVEFLQKNLSPEDGQIGLCWLGTLSYYMPQYKFADFLGKADSHIAHEDPKWGPVGHNKWDIEYSLVAHHISAIPIEPSEADYDSAVQVMHSKRPFGFWAAIVTDPYTRTHYTYLSPNELNIPSTWGLLVRNDLIPRLQLAK